MSSKFLYSCYLLTRESKMQLLRWLYENKMAQHEHPHLHHCTIQFGTDTIVDDSVVGRPVDLAVIGYCRDEYAAAFLVGECMSTNTQPHITVSCADGVKPFYSNQMLSRPKGELEIGLFKGPLIIRAIIQKIYADFVLF